MSTRQRRTVLIWLLLAIVALLLIAMALPSLALLPGVPLPSEDLELQQGPWRYPSNVSVTNETYFKSILIITLIAAAIGSVIRILRGGAWKEIPVFAILIAVPVVIVVCILFAQAKIRIAEPAAAEVLPPDLQPNGPPIGPLPVSLMWFVWAGFAAVIAFLAYRFFFRNRKSAPYQDSVQQQAKEALRALESGGDVRDVIARCYVRMSVVMQQERGVALEETMTTREFERELISRGVSGAAVQALTRLFEKVRYGGQSASLEDEQRAKDCLKMIIGSGDGI